MSRSAFSSRGRRIKRVNYSDSSRAVSIESDDHETSDHETSDSDYEESAPIATRSSKPKKAKKTKRKLKRKRRLETPPPSPSDSNDESSSDDCVVLNPPTKKKKRSKPTASAPSAPAPRKKRRLAPPPRLISLDDDDEDEDEDVVIADVTPQKKKKRTKKPPAEKRQARFRGSCPQKTRERIVRARNQRLYMINATVESEICRSYAVLGSTGNVYHIVIAQLPQCSCPDFAKGNLCKHILFVMLKVLRVDPASQHVYQRGLLTTELNEIFANAPQTLINNVVASRAVLQNYAEASGEEVDTEPAKEVVRKELEGNDCPICMEEFDADEKDDLVWCQAQCGQNVHADCFNMWATNARGSGDPVSCVFCRAPWQENANQAGRKKKANKIANKVKYNEGYMNLGQEQGLSSSRDTSSYHPSWNGGWYNRGRYGRRRRWGYGY